ncbi:MAG: D-alanyl-D-alanine carboxypeptidase [Acidimicrobiales bacterium]
MAGSTPATCLVVTVDGRVITSQNAELPVVPASNEKVLTTFTAMAILGPDHTFVTEVRASGTVVDGVLTGDLFLVGGGDPFLATDNWWTQFDTQDGRAHTRLETLADAVAASGITSVTGSLFGDDTLFDQERYGPWATRLIDTRQSGPLSALAVNEGFISWPEQYTGSFRPRVPTDDPPSHAAAVFAQLLGERGVTVSSGGAATAPAEASPLAQVVSPPLSELITHINSYSNNFGAEILLKHIGRDQRGIGSTANGAAAMMTFLTEQGFDMNGVNLLDGSGLSEETTLTCQLLTDVLLAAGPGSPFARRACRSVGSRRFDRAPRCHRCDRAGVCQDRHTQRRHGTLRICVFAVEAGTTLTFAYVVNGELAGRDERIRGLQEPFVEQLATYQQDRVEISSPRSPQWSIHCEAAARRLVRRHDRLSW